MDITSVEFYTLAFVVAMALVALLMGRREKNPPSTYIVQLATSPAEDDAAEDTVLLQPTESGNAILLKRTGINIGPEDTVNLVINVQEDSCSIVEKKGRKSRKGVIGDPVTGEAVLKCLRPGCKYRMRYESQLNSTWATFSLDPSSPEPREVKLRF
ncbi:MAG: hypothetical protein IJK41_09285 [Muribaculaceae bacterium]|nr:hypothetical protein [Muribaculaceae bacterium]